MAFPHSFHTSLYDTCPKRDSCPCAQPTCIPSISALGSPLSCICFLFVCCLSFLSLSLSLFLAFEYQRSPLIHPPAYSSTSASIHSNIAFTPSSSPHAVLPYNITFIPPTLFAYFTHRPPPSLLTLLSASFRSSIPLLYSTFKN
jgi:hypothetical protein